MFFYEGQSCPVCGKPFKETDDIVSCPVCGAPHHRACWMQDGHCHFEKDHGTPAQWKKPSIGETPEEKSNRCPNCGFVNPEHAEFCAHCGRTLEAKEWSFEGERPPQYGQSAPYNEYAPFRAVFDPLGGVKRDEKFEDGISAEDLAICVGGNTQYYLPKFQKIKNGRTVQWNWAAFLIAPYWLLYRKQYVAGAIVSAFYLLFDLILNAIFHLSGAGSDMISYQEAIQMADAAGYFPAMFVLSIAMMIIWVACGLFGNKLYYSSCIKKVRQAKEENPVEYPQTLRKTGGVSVLWGAVSYFSISFLSTILMLLAPYFL